MSPIGCLLPARAGNYGDRCCDALRGTGPPSEEDDLQGFRICVSESGAVFCLDCGLGARRAKDLGCGPFILDVFWACEVPTRQGMNMLLLNQLNRRRCRLQKLAAFGAVAQAVLTKPLAAEHVHGYEYDR